MIDWHADRLTRMIEAELERRLQRAAEEIAAETRQLLCETAGNKPSRPGELPHRQSGALAESITVERPAPLVRRIGSGVDHAVPLEAGTRRMAPRPYLTRVLDRSVSTLRERLLGTDQ